MATRSDVVTKAKTQVGYVESPAGSNNTKYGIWYGMNNEPWCAMFVSWVYAQVGIPLDISTPKGYAYCPSGVDYFKHRGLWRSSYRSQPGDPVFFSWDGSGVAEHTGIILSNNPLQSWVTTVEGNTGSTSASNGGTVAICQRPRSLILGTGNTSYLFNGKSSTPPPPPQPSWMKDGFAHPELKLGATGRSVHHMQNKLLIHGANIVVDGVFGDHTLRSLKNYQASHGLTSDGVCGLHTWEHLHK